MPLESQDLPAISTESGFTQMIFEELQTEYPKDPARFAKMYNHLKLDSDSISTSVEDRTDSQQNLCLLDLAVASLKAKAGDRQEATIMYDDAMSYLSKLNKNPENKTTRTIQSIAQQVEKSL